MKVLPLILAAVVGFLSMAAFTLWVLIFHTVTRELLTIWTGGYR